LKISALRLNPGGVQLSIKVAEHNAPEAVPDPMPDKVERMAKLFAYGTLQMPEVFRAVTGRSLPARPATLAGYARYRLRGLSYPGLIAEPGAVTEGLLITGIEPRELARLDHFEDDFYRRVTLRVSIGAGELVRADVYVIPAAHRDLIEPRLWQLDAFVLDEGPEFLRRCRTGGACAGDRGA
jgi:gamma-glutamylcyclotransferase (GGCT)/AIG2-like uncharacterized protein YtfP